MVNRNSLDARAHHPAASWAAPLIDYEHPCPDPTPPADTNGERCTPTAACAGRGDRRAAAYAGGGGAEGTVGPADDQVIVAPAGPRTTQDLTAEAGLSAGPPRG
ncbi:hypothetical protein MCBG_00026 [Micromonospora sp. M42]|nr:hypothetical protein MCBG_00026 [Micromonospora sp. M42]